MRSNIYRWEYMDVLGGFQIITNAKLGFSEEKKLSNKETRFFLLTSHFLPPSFLSASLTDNGSSLFYTRYYCRKLEREGNCLISIKRRSALDNRNQTLDRYALSITRIDRELILSRFDNRDNGKPRAMISKTKIT